MKRSLQILGLAVAALLTISGCSAQPGPATPENTPTSDGEVIPFDSVAAGAIVSYGIDAQQQVFYWGYNEYIESDTEAQLVPVLDETLSDLQISKIVPGEYISLALTSGGKVLAWGHGTNGLLGDGAEDGPNASIPVEVPLPADKTFVDVASGRNLAIALSDDGVVYGWGNMRYLGLDEDAVTTPIRLPLPENETFTQISAGGASGFAVNSEGVAYAFGLGELGVETVLGAGLGPKLPVLPGGASFKAISAGSDTVIALSEDGKVFAWGDGLFGALGNGSEEESETPVQVLIPEGVVISDIVSSGFSSFAISEGGEVYAWGLGDNGRLGTGSEERSNPTPALVKIPSTVQLKQLSVGEAHALLLDSDGNVFAWGINESGQLATGDREDQSVPTPMIMPRG